MMRSFMMRRCDMYFTLRKKTERFLRMAFDVYHVPTDVAEKAVQKVAAIDVNSAVDAVMKKLFAMLEMTFDFKFATT